MSEYTYIIISSKPSSNASLSPKVLAVATFENYEFLICDFYIAYMLLF